MWEDGLTDKEQQIKHSLIYLMPVIIGNLIPIITMPIFTRILTKEDYGVLALAQVYAIFMSGLSNFGLTVSFERNFFQYKESKKIFQLLYSTLIFVICIFSIIILLTYLFKTHLARWVIGSSEHAGLLFLSTCATGIMGLKTYYLTYFKNDGNAKSFVWYTVGENILNIVLSLFMVVYLRIGVYGLVFGQLASSLVIFIILSLSFLKLYPASFNWLLLRDALKLSFPLTPKIFFGIIGGQFDKYMIGLMGSIGGVGIYSLGQKVSYSIFMFMTAIQNVFSPQVYKRMFDMEDGGAESIGRYLTPFVYISTGFAMIIALFSEELIGILTPESYHGAIDIVIILSMFYGSLFFAKQPQLIFAKKTFVNSLLSLLNIALNIAINIPFIMRWGAVGAAWGTLTAGLLWGAFSFAVSQHYYNIRWEYRKIIALFLIFFASAVLLTFLRASALDFRYRLIFKLALISCYVYLGVKIRVLTVENYNLLKNVLLLKKNLILPQLKEG